MEMAEWTGLGLDQDVLQKETKQGLGNTGNGERQVKNCSRPCSLCNSARGGIRKDGSVPLRYQSGSSTWIWKSIDEKEGLEA